jgi:hypothetical protein
MLRICPVSSPTEIHRSTYRSAQYLVGALSDKQAEKITGLQHETLSANRRHLVEDEYVMESGDFDYTTKRRRIRWTPPPPPRALIAGDRVDEAYAAHNARFACTAQLLSSV